jgi:hypothetical protein
MNSGSWTEDDDDDPAYGVWYTFDHKSFESEETRLRPFRPADDTWPSWEDGVPNSFRRTFFVTPFSTPTATYKMGDYPVTIAFVWSAPRDLEVLRTSYRYLPSLYRSQWSGVYRLFAKDAVIERCCGADATGTLYIGKAGTGKQNWSILRSRIMQLVKREHHATSHWHGCDKTRSKFPWDSLAAAWAFTGEYTDYRGARQPAATLAERWLLGTYRDSFGELPPWNKK